MKPCRKWLERDAAGRPRCEHGWAHKAGTRWRCPEKKRLVDRRYMSTDKGRANDRRKNATEAAKSRKAIYELTRIRVS